MMPKLIIFDLDGTLHEPFEPPTDETLRRIEALLHRVPVAFLTGATFERIDEHTLQALEHAHGELIVMPNSGALCYRFIDNEWRVEYDDSLTDEERVHIHAAVNDVIASRPELQDATVIDCPGLVALACIDTTSPRSVKAAWDPTGEKRRDIMADLAPRLNECECYLGGGTTIDIARKGMNKSYGIRWLLKHYSLRPEDALFIGDALYPGGNDFPVVATGVTTKQVASVEKTMTFIDELLK